MNNNKGYYLKWLGIFYYDENNLINFCIKFTIYFIVILIIINFDNKFNISFN